MKTQDLTKYHSVDVTLITELGRPITKQFFGPTEGIHGGLGGPVASASCEAWNWIRDTAATGVLGGVGIDDQLIVRAFVYKHGTGVCEEWNLSDPSKEPDDIPIPSPVWSWGHKSKENK